MATSDDIKAAGDKLDSVAGTNVSGVFTSLQNYTSAIPPEFTKQVNDQIDKVAGDTGVGAGVKAGLAGAAAGVGVGGTIAASVCGAAVGIGVLATGAVALQTIPIVGTIAGAVLGLVAGLWAFFASKTKQESAEQKKLNATLMDLSRHYFESLSPLPQELNEAGWRLWNDCVTRAKNSTDDYSKKAGDLDGPKYLAALIGEAQKLPSQLAGLIIDWAAKQAKIERDATTFAAKLSGVVAGKPIGYVPPIGMTSTQKVLIGGGFAAAVTAAVVAWYRNKKGARA